MIPRIEQKAELSPTNYPRIIDWLFSNNFKILFPERIVSSIYFDNYFFQSYNDTVEGITPRRKIRIREYGVDAFKNKKNKYNLEIKLSSEFYRFKSNQVIYDLQESLNNGIVDSQYGICLPKVKITYNREYFIYESWRVTIDKLIHYENLNVDNSISKEPNLVVEIKTNINENYTKLKNFFEFPRSKFSKYERAIDSLYSN